MQNGTQSFQRYSPIPGRGVIEGDYEPIDTLDDRSYLSGNIYMFFNLVIIILLIL